jgi:hypothetical protein
VSGQVRVLTSLSLEKELLVTIGQESEWVAELVTLLKGRTPLTQKSNAAQEMPFLIIDAFISNVQS